MECAVKALFAFAFGIELGFRATNQPSGSTVALTHVLKRPDAVKIELLGWGGRITRRLALTWIVATDIDDLCAHRSIVHTAMKCKATGRALLLVMSPFTFGLWLLRRIGPCLAVEYSEVVIRGQSSAVISG